MLFSAYLFLPVSLEQVFEGLYYKSRISERSSFLFFFGNIVYAVVENFIIVHFLSVTTSVNLPRKNIVKGNEREIISEPI